MYEIRATFKGLTHKMDDRFYNPEVTDPGGNRKSGKDAWKKELAHKAYFDDKGAYVPADNIRMMLIGNKHRRGAATILGSDIESGKKGTKYKSMCEGCIWVLGPSDPLKIYIEPKRKTYDDYDERSFINANGGRNLTRRPIIKTPWSITFIIQVTDDRIDETWVRQLFDVAGLRCGVGAYGPTFGRCIITEWIVLDKESKVPVQTPKNNTRAKSHGKKKKDKKP